MLGLALAAVQAALLLTVAVVGLIIDLSADRILQITALAWLGGPLVALFVVGAVHLRLSAAAASAARPATDLRDVADEGRSSTQPERVLREAYDRAGR